jgi:hypothetical protein
MAGGDEKKLTDAFGKIPVVAVSPESALSSQTGVRELPLGAVLSFEGLI